MKRLTLFVCLFMLAACQNLERWVEHDVAGLQAAMDEGRLTSRELSRFYLKRIRALDRQGPALGAVIEVNPDALAIAAALDAERKISGPRGPLHGIPVLLKANIDSGDAMATSAGSLALAEHRASRDAFLVARLREAGAIILGKTNLSEWANFRSTRSTSGWSSLGGQTRNPYDPSRNPCGSSSGSAVAVAANLATLAVGTETDGSIVCPASMNGIVGIKPTLGLVSRDGIIPIALSQDTAGPMARTVRDAALLLQVLAAPDPSDPAFPGRPEPLPDYRAAAEAGNLAGKRIGMLMNYSGAGGDPRVEDILAHSAAVLATAGADIVSVDIDVSGLWEAEYTVLLHEFRVGLNAYLGASGAAPASLADIIAFNEAEQKRVMPYFGQDILEKAEATGGLDADEYREALSLAQGIARGGLDRAFREHRLDALIAPTNGPAWMTDTINGDRFSVGSSSLAAVSGYASITVPAGDISGLPIGISFIGAAFSEPVLLGLAHGFEQATRHRRAPRLDRR